MSNPTGGAIMNTEIHELSFAELDCVCAGMDVAGAMKTIGNVAVGLVVAGLSALGGGVGSGVSAGAGAAGHGGVAPQQTWM
jgi:hypothetical protein